jgi:glycosyl transferase family 25
VAETVGVSLHRLPLPPLRMSAQLVSLDAARALRAASDRFDRPVDTFIQMHWVHGVHAVCAVPSGVRDRTVESGGSTIQRKPPLREKLWREWARFRYRRAVARRARG